MSRPLLELMRMQVLALTLVASACGGPAKPPTEDVVVWRPLGSWTGHNVMQTEAFISDTGALRITWETRNETVPGRGAFTITLHSGVSGRPLLEAVEHKGVGHAVAYVTEDPREFFLVIESSNLDWAVAVAEAVSATAPPHTPPNTNR